MFKQFVNFQFNISKNIGIQIKYVVNLDIVTQGFESIDGKYFHFQINNYLRNWKQSNLLKGNRTDYEWHRSGSSQVNGTGKWIKWLPSCKIDLTCLAQAAVHI